jgi:hypothetical protein
MFGLHLVRSGEKEPEWSAYLIESSMIASQLIMMLKPIFLKKGLKEKELRKKQN